MYYEIYIDQFLLEHLLTGGILIYLSGILTHHPISPRRVAAGSAANAAAQAMLLLTGCPIWYLLGLILGGTAAYLDRDWKKIPGKLLALLFVTLCFGGTLEAILELTGLPWLAALLCAAVILRGLYRLRQKKNAAQAAGATVTLKWQERTVTVRAIIDTGNQLTEPATGRPVSILDQEAAEALLGEGWEERRGFYLIPYHSIGRKQGWMRGVTVDEINIETDRQKRKIHSPVVAICQGQVSGKGKYQMILHPLHTEEAGASGPDRPPQPTKKERQK